MQLQGLRLGIEPAPSGSLNQRSTNWATEAVADSFGTSSVPNALPTELQKPLLTASARVLYFCIYIYIYMCVCVRVCVCVCGNAGKV